MRAQPFLLPLMLLLALFAGGCRGCGGGKHIAEVTKHQGDVTRDTASSLQKWQPAADGAKLSLGDGLKTGGNAGAEVKLISGGKLALSSDTTVRFLASAPGAGPKLAIETGEASIEADDRALAVETTIGRAQIEAGGKLRLTAGEGGRTRVEVTVGGARLETDDGGVNLSAGKPIEVSIGGAVVEREAADASADAEPKRAEVVADPTDGGGGPVSLEVRGAGVRVQTGGAGAWQPVAEGAATASAGDAVDVPGGASVEVRRGARRARVGQGRHVIGDGAALLRAGGGHVELEATTEDVAVQVPGGVIVAKSGGKSRVDADVAGTGTKVSVRQGTGDVRGATATETLRVGESAVLSPKGAIVIAGRGPERADFTVRAGDTIVVRDPRPPTAVGIDFSSVCPAAAVVSRGDGAKVRGERGKAVLTVTGHQEYTVRCIGPDGVEEKAAATGGITVVADAARAELARLPPSTVVDTDGRRYTVLYQNQLPAVVARWPDAPASSGGYVLHVDKDRSKAPAAKQSLRPGSLGEGTHALWFETADGAKRSAETTLVIKFDNAAPAASVRDPVDGSFQPGDTVKVSGIVVEGWTVSVNGQAIPLDEQKRFSSTATVPSGENALVLRLSHPKRGTVFYVRHAGGTR